MKRIHERIANVALVLTSVVATLLVAEVCLQIDDRNPDLAEFEREFSLNGEKERFLVEGNEFADPRNAVLILGDSFARGTACGNARTYPSAFSRAAKEAGTDFRAVNLGVNGAGPLTYLRWARNYLAEKGRAAGIVVTLYANDLDSGCAECGMAHKDLAHASGITKEWTTICTPCLAQGSGVFSAEFARRAYTWIAQRSNLYRTVREAGLKIVMSSGWRDEGWGRLAYPAQWKDFEGTRFKLLEGTLKQISAEAQKHNSSMIVVFYPDVTNLTPEDHYVHIYERASARLAADIGVPVISGFEAFLGHPDAETSMAFSLSDAHPNCKAHAIFGAWVYKQWRAHHRHD